LEFINIVPGAPENLKVEVLNIAVKISWQPPLLANGIIIFYNITYNGSRYELQLVSNDIRTYAKSMKNK